MGRWSMPRYIVLGAGWPLVLVLAKMSRRGKPQMCKIATAYILQILPDKIFSAGISCSSKLTVLTPRIEKSPRPFPAAPRNSN